jgi:hypothetical protein
MVSFQAIVEGLNRTSSNNSKRAWRPNERIELTHVFPSIHARHPRSQGALRSNPTFAPLVAGGRSKLEWQVGGAGDLLKVVLEERAHPSD